MAHGDAATAAYDHVCEDIAHLMPRMQHLKIRFRRLCESILLEKSRSTARTDIPEGRRKYLVAPNLQSLVIGLSPKMKSNPEFCTKSRATRASTIRAKAWSRRTGKAKLHGVLEAVQAAYLSQSFPLAKRLCILDRVERHGSFTYD